MTDALYLFLSDYLMYSPHSYSSLIARYHESIWPWHVIPLLAGGLMLFSIFKPTQHSDRLINLGLAACWYWVAIAFHFQTFSTINLAAWGFGLLFLLQGSVFLVFGVFSNQITYQSDPIKYPGLSISVVAIILYPGLLFLSGGDWTQGSFFGSSPDATAIGSIGLILMTKTPIRRVWVGVWLLLPIVWCLMSLVMTWVVTKNI